MTEAAVAPRKPVDPLVHAVGLLGNDRGDGTREYSTEAVVAADDHGLLGVLNREVDAGRVVVGSAAAAMLSTLTKHATAEAVALEARAATAVTMLRDDGIDALVLKGAAVAHLDYPDPAWRQFGDVDLLVRGSDIGAAVDAFGRHGFRRHFTEPFDGFDELIGKGVAVEDATGAVFDLHRTLALGYYGTRLPVATLWEDTTTFVLADVEMAALSSVGRFVHCALHLALTPRPRIANGLDLAIIGPRLDADRITAVARSWGCAHPIALAIETTSGWFGDEWAPPGLLEWANGNRPTTADRVAMSAFRGPLAGTRMRSMTAVLGLPSGRLKRAAIRGAIIGGHHERE